MIRLGFHLSIAGGMANAPKEAGEKDYRAFQVFTTSSRSWKNSHIDASDRDRFVDYSKAGDVKPFAHIPYLCNPASPNQPVYDKSKRMLIDNIRNCHSLGIDGLVIHLGSHLGKGPEVGIENICNAIVPALEATEKVSILLENGSGYNNSVGSKFDEIGKIIETIGSDRIGVCLDTCHAFAAGYEIKSQGSVDKMVDEFDSCVGLSKIRLVHLNDAKFPLGSGKDRHWHIGKGFIGEEGFESFFKNRAFRSGSFVMELPEDSEGTHASDMAAIKSILAETM